VQKEHVVPGRWIRLIIWLSSFAAKSTPSVEMAGGGGGGGGAPVA